MASDHLESWRIFPAAGETTDESVIEASLYTPEPAETEAARGGVVPPIRADARHRQRRGLSGRRGRAAWARRRGAGVPSRSGDTSPRSRTSIARSRASSGSRRLGLPDGLVRYPRSALRPGAPHRDGRHDPGLAPVRLRSCCSPSCWPSKSVFPFRPCPFCSASARLAGAGRMSVALALGVALVASLTPDIVWYELGRRRGGRVLRPSLSDLARAGLVRPARRGLVRQARSRRPAGRKVLPA